MRPQNLKPQTSQSQFYKVIVIGDAGVGKTSFVKKLSTGKQPQSLKPTVGVDFSMSSFRLSNGCKIKAQIWDTGIFCINQAGSQKYRSVTSIHYRKSNGAIVMFDLTNRQSFNNAKVWINKVKQLCQAKVVIMLIGNKNDLPNQAVTSQQIQQFAIKQNVMYDQISTKQGKISKPFQVLLEQINRIYESEQIQKSMVLKPRNQQTTSDTCNC